MKTKEQNVSKDTVLLLSFVSILVFCSFVVSNQLTDILYFFVIIAYILYYKLVRKNDIEE